MSQTAYDEVNLMLRLYELRREQGLRQARSWFLEQFHSKSPEEIARKYPEGSAESNWIKMVVSYWDMVASVTNRGLIADEMFFESNGEIWSSGSVFVRSSRPGDAHIAILISYRISSKPANASSFGGKRRRRVQAQDCARCSINDLVAPLQRCLGSTRVP
jgi:hypothetical protein